LREEGRKSQPRSHRAATPRSLFRGAPHPKKIIRSKLIYIEIRAPYSRASKDVSRKYFFWQDLIELTTSKQKVGFYQSARDDVN